MVKTSSSSVANLTFDSCFFSGDSSRSSHISDFKICTPMATLPGAWRYRVSVGTVWLSVSILWLGEIENLICNFYLSVAVWKIVWADLSLRYTRILLAHKSNQPTNKKINNKKKNNIPVCNKVSTRQRNRNLKNRWSNSMYCWVPVLERLQGAAEY